MFILLEYIVFGEWFYPVLKNTFSGKIRVGIKSMIKPDNNSKWQFLKVFPFHLLGKNTQKNCFIFILSRQISKTFQSCGKRKKFRILHYQIFLALYQMKMKQTTSFLLFSDSDSPYLLYYLSKEWDPPRLVRGNAKTNFLNLHARKQTKTSAKNPKKNFKIGNFCILIIYCKINFFALLPLKG